MHRSSCGIPSDRLSPSADRPTRKTPDASHLNRIEEWVISTVDGRQKTTAIADWTSTIEDFTVEKRTDRAQAARPDSPATTAGWTRFRLSRRKDVVIVSLTDQAIIKDDDLLEMTGDLLAIFEAGYPRIILDFFLVERLSSRAAAAIGEVVRAGFSDEGGIVKFSGVRPELAAVFAMTALDPRVASYPDTASAVCGLWPDQPEFLPLPVSILSALMRVEDARSSLKSRIRTLGVGRIYPASTTRADEGHATMSTTRLIIQDGTMMGRSFAVKGEKFLIGRGTECHLRLGYATVSRSHAIIESRGSRQFLRDLASTNGTFLNGHPLRNTLAEIRDGDRIQIGKIELILAVGHGAGSLGRIEQADHEFLSLEEGDISGFRNDPDATEDYPEADDHGEESGLKYEVIEDTLVVTPLASELADDANVDDFRNALLKFYERRLPKRVVVNLVHVGYLSSRMIGILVSHHLRLDHSGGALRLCLANPRVAVVLNQVKIGMLIECHATVEDAVISVWPSSLASSN